MRVKIKQKKSPVVTGGAYVKLENPNQIQCCTSTSRKNHNDGSLPSRLEVRTQHLVESALQSYEHNWIKSYRINMSNVPEETKQAKNQIHMGYVHECFMAWGTSSTNINSNANTIHKCNPQIYFLITSNLTKQRPSDLSQRSKAKPYTWTHPQEPIL